MSKFTEIYIFWRLQGGIPSFHKRMCILESHEYTISVSFGQNLYIYDLGGCKGAAPPCLRNFVFGGLNMHKFRLLF